MSKTRIVVLQMKEIIYTGIFVALGVFLVLLLVLMFHPEQEKAPETSQAEAVYRAGVYTTEIALGQTILNLEAYIDETHIKGARLVNLSEEMETMYPLLSPSLEDISSQLANGVAIENVVLSDENQYTQTLLLSALQELLKKAEKN